MAIPYCMKYMLAETLIQDAALHLAGKDQKRLLALFSADLKIEDLMAEPLNYAVIMPWAYQNDCLFFSCH